MIFVTDRTESPRTYYNYTDLNRVEGNVFLISELLIQYGHYIDLEIKDDWSTVDFPKATEMIRYIGNVNVVKDAYHSLAPVPPINMNNLNYVGANNIEKTLESVYDILNESIKSIDVLEFTLGGGEFE